MGNGVPRPAQRRHQARRRWRASGTVSQTTFVGTVTLYDIEVVGQRLVVQSAVGIPIGTRVGLRAAEYDVTRFV